MATALTTCVMTSFSLCKRFSGRGNSDEGKCEYSDGVFQSGLQWMSLHVKWPKLQRSFAFTRNHLTVEPSRATAPFRSVAPVRRSLWVARNARLRNFAASGPRPCLYSGRRQARTGAWERARGWFRLSGFQGRTLAR